MTQEEQMAMMKELETLRARVSSLESELLEASSDSSSDASLEKRDAVIDLQSNVIEKQGGIIEKQNEEIRIKTATIESKDRLIKEKDAEIYKLSSRLDWLQKKVFGRMSEKKYLPNNPEDIYPTLFPMEDQQENQSAASSDLESAETTMTTTIRAKSKPSRRKLDTTGLPVEVIEIYPEGTTDEEGNLLPGYTVIGREVSESLKVVPAKVSIVRTITNKVILTSEIETKEPEERTIIEAEKPLQAINKCMAGPTVLADIIILKFLYHLPFYRIIQQYKEAGITISDSTMGGWYEATVDRLKVLYDLLRCKVLKSVYVQVDESTLPVIDNEKHRARKGYEWIVRDGIEGDVFFWYDCGSRSYKTARTLLSRYQGTIQTDGYGAYDQFEGKKGVQIAGCWAHARRKYIEAQKEDKKRADYALTIIRQLYAIESEATEKEMTPEDRCTLRREKSYPLIKQYEKWLEDNYCQVLPKSRIGRAIAYSYGLIERLSIYVNDGRINIDNNLIENQVRPLAIGRKNYLFCGNDASAYRAAIVYSLIGTCKARNVDPRKWMVDVLEKMPYYERDGKDMSDLLPGSWAQSHNM